MYQLFQGFLCQEITLVLVKTIQDQKLLVGKQVDRIFIKEEIDDRQLFAIGSILFTIDIPKGS